MSRVDEINARGFAKGWHAMTLELLASRQGGTMAEHHQRMVQNSSAFNVPAECTRVTADWIFYRFSDGSTARYPNPKGNQ